MSFRFLISLFLIVSSVPAYGGTSDYVQISLESSQACPDRNSSTPHKVGKVICLRGQITQKTRKAFLDLSPQRGDVVVTSGPGGDIAAAMDIGDFIYKYDLFTVVDDLCGSSCAYFIALGGRRLALIDNGLLGFHGGPVPEEKIMSLPGISQKDRIKILFDNARFRQFFDARGVHIAITFTPPESLKDDPTDWTTSMWVRTPDELPKFGFDRVVFCSAKYCAKPQ